ncbi:MAG: DUF4294 domain-containing protein [Bacteroidetes bacterium]|nr:DUF4294 domain-containing protein [Bacteroidota bacterium]
MGRVVFIVFFLGLVSQVTSGQDTNWIKLDTVGRYHLIQIINRSGERMPEIELEDVVVVGKRSAGDRFQAWRYARLVYNVRKVYPYSVMIRDRYAEVNRHLSNMPDDKLRKEYLKKLEKDLFREYEDDLRSMTITQGRILIKLVDRETKNSSYDLIKEYRSAVTATFWQGIARIFGSNLKDKYDPDGDDFLIEMIIYEIEAGRL